MHIINTLQKKLILGALFILLIGVAVYFFMPEDLGSNPELQKQIMNSKELKDVVNSPRNDFKSGSYTLDAARSSIAWKYGDTTGKIPLTSGSLSVLRGGRIEGFSVVADVKGLSVVSGGTTQADITTLLSLSANPTGKMTASTVLPNTVDDAFTVAFSLEAAGKTTSLATGMFVTHGDNGEIVVRGDITIDPKSLGFADASENITITPEYIFE
jgi:hypothetical protein